MPKLSIVIPVFNEEESLDVLLSELKESLGTADFSYEIVFVNDGSTDASLEKLKGYQSRGSGFLKIVNLPQRQGQTAALKKGLQSAQGDMVVSLDADLQNDPADIPRLLEKMKEGFDVVCGWRKDRSDPSIKKILSKFGNLLQRSISGFNIHDVSCTLRVYRRECLKDLTLDWEGQHRFIPLILFKKGYKAAEVTTHHRSRRFGYSKYSHKRIFKVMADFFRVLRS